LSTSKFIGVEDFPTQVIWRKEAPTKINCFCWKVFFKKIATVDNLQRKGIALANRCVMRLKCSESVDHLLLHCEFVTSIWNHLSSTLSFHGPRLGEVRSFFTDWKGLNCDPAFERVKNVLLHALFWSVWTERNSRIFAEKFGSVSDIQHRLWGMIFLWIKVACTLSAAKISALRYRVFENGQGLASVAFLSR
ncbi:hypothetical protein LINPERPRIM_LOCUS36883, partial [Linum perenne]